MSEIETSTTQGISRRSLAAGVAWTAPAIWMASAAPAVAASFDLKETWLSAQYSCNNEGWKMGFALTNPGIANLKVVTVVISVGTYSWTATPNQNLPIQVAPTTFIKGWTPWKVGGVDQGASVFGASPTGGADGLFSNFATTGSCLVGNDPDCTCTNGSVCIGPCLIMAKLGSLKVTFTMQIGNNVASQWNVVLNGALPSQCGTNNWDDCDNFVT